MKGSLGVEPNQQLTIGSIVPVGSTDSVKGWKWGVGQWDKRIARLLQFAGKGLDDL